MGDPAAAVTDTHPLIFHAARSPMLGSRSAAFYARCERQEAILYVPVPVIWECSVLVRAGKIDLGRSLRSFFDDLFSNPAYQPLDLSTEQVYLADECGFSRDPFDSLIVAAASVLDLLLITRDSEIIDSGAVKSFW